jgi:hypothetical protein
VFTLTPLPPPLGRGGKCTRRVTETPYNAQTEPNTDIELLHHEVSGLSGVVQMAFLGGADTVVGLTAAGAVWHAGLEHA